MNGIEKITERIIAEAKAAEAAALADAKQKADGILAEGEREAEEIRDRIVDRAAREGESTFPAPNDAAMTRRNTDLAVRGEMIDEAFAQAFAQIRALPAEEYLSLLCRFLGDALLEQLAAAAESRALHGDEVEDVAVYEVLLNDVDRRTLGQSLIDETRRQLIGRADPAALAKLTLSGKTVNITGGVILRYGDVESNCSFETVFAQVRADREAEVGRILFA